MTKKITLKDGATNSKKKCASCEKTIASKDNFYNTTEKAFFIDGKISICKTCCATMLEKRGFEGFKSLLRMINKPLLQDVFKGDYGDYIRMVNSMPQYKNMVYDDSTMFKEPKALEVFKRAKPTELSPEELLDAEEFWGIGYEEKEYIWLNSEYVDYLDRYEVNSKTLENLIREICLVQLDIRSSRSKKLDVKNELKAYNDLLTAANLKPVQETGADSIEQETFGTFIKKIENDRPISEPHPDWADVDGIGKYIRTFFLGHMARMFGKENKYQEEYDEELGKYSVSAEDDEQEVD